MNVGANTEIAYLRANANGDMADIGDLINEFIKDKYVYNKKIDIIAEICGICYARFQRLMEARRIRRIYEHNIKHPEDIRMAMNTKGVYNYIIRFYKILERHAYTIDNISMARYTKSTSIIYAYDKHYREYEEAVIKLAYNRRYVDLKIVFARLHKLLYYDLFYPLIDFHRISVTI